MSETPTTVTVEATQEHTYQGKTYKVGDTYEIEAALADSIVVQGKAIRRRPASAPPAKAKP